MCQWQGIFKENLDLWKSALCNITYVIPGIQYPVSATDTANLPFFLMPLAKKKETSLSSRAGLSKKGIAKTLRGYFFELFDCTSTSGIKEIVDHFLPDFCAFIFMPKRALGQWTSQKPREMGHTLYR